MTMNNNSKRSSPEVKIGSLGTFSGVFTPSILTILGIILFLRMGYVVGSAGLGRALLIIGLANVISVLTSVSLSAISTNLRVKGGGVYYLISRTLGMEFGGSIGIVLFLAQSVSIAFYCIGFGEALSGILGVESRHASQIIAACAIGFLFIFAWMGADWATRFQYVVMAILGLALLSFFLGGFMKWDTATLVRNWSSPASGPGFWIIFAIFFPAATGFTQGSFMSGDLKDPGKSLPLGTFAAVGLSIIVYFGAAFIFAASLPAAALISDYGAMKRIALTGILINAGVIAATLSSAMASFLGAPRILQSLAQDRIFPFLLPFAKGHGETQNPRRAVLLSAGIAFATVGLGKLNLIAPVVSMFFLISYGLLNYATYFEARSSSPSFRPRFKWFHPKLSLLGWIACLGVMLAIDVKAGVVAISVLFAVQQYLKRTAGPSRWADSRRSYHLQRVREEILAVAAEEEHPRDWRPIILAFSDHPQRRTRLLRFSSWLEGGTGLTTVVRVLEGEGIKMLKLKNEAEQTLRSDIRESNVNAFPLVLTAPKLSAGIEALAQAYGIGPIRANTILLNWPRHIDDGVPELHSLKFGTNLRAGFRLGCNLVVLDASEEEWVGLQGMPSGARRIDVWWWDDATSRLMLLLAYLVTRHPEWGEATIRVIAPAGEEGAITLEGLQKTLDEIRIEATPEIIEKPGPQALREKSRDAALVFIPFRIRGNKLLDPLGEPIEALLPHLPVAALVSAAEDIELDAAPEEGRAGEMAEALDALSDAEKKAREAEKEAVSASDEAKEKISDVESAVADAAQEDLMEKVKAALEAREEAIKATRRHAKASAKEKDARKEAESLGALPEEGEPEESVNKDTPDDSKLP